jgi:hypothetical protein
MATATDYRRIATSSTWYIRAAITDAEYTGTFSNDGTWSHWNNNCDASTSTSDPYTVWTDWNTQYEIMIFDRFIEQKKTKRQLEVVSRQNRILDRRRKRKQLMVERRNRNLAIMLRLEKEAAENIAKELLLELIGPNELAIFEETKRLLIKGSEYDYIIPLEGHIKRLEKDKVTDLCIHLKDQNKYPLRDNVVGLKLLLESNENEFNKIANIHECIPRNRFRIPECARG